MHFQKKEKERNKYSTFGNHQFENVYTGETVTPITLSMDHGEKNFHMLGISSKDTGIANRVGGVGKQELCKKITFPVDKNILTGDDIINYNKIEDYKEMTELDEFFVNDLPYPAIHKIIEYQDQLKKQKVESTL